MHTWRDVMMICGVLLLLLGDIKDYFGEKIGIYFLYLEYYIKQLALPAILGVVAFIGTPVY